MAITTWTASWLSNYSAHVLIVLLYFNPVKTVFCEYSNRNCHSCQIITQDLFYFHPKAPVCQTKSNVNPRKSSIFDWEFDHRPLLLNTFPIDTEKRNYVREVRNAIFSLVDPIPFRTEVKLIAVSNKVLNDILDLNPDIANDKKYSKDFIRFVSGSLILDGSTPLAHRYGGHQFGDWADQLGDGRAVMLGEYTNFEGERWELQLKGSGRTPYSRRGDGRAVLRSSVREFLCSEALHYLGIPTSRAASLVVSDDPIMRDQFYDGRPKVERGAAVLRLAKSWFRIGSLEILSKNGEIDLLRQVVDFIIQNHFPHLSSNEQNKYLAFYSEVVSGTAKMIAMWQSVGFTHGVCNTDNFSLLAITIDFGPFGFMEKYNPSFVPNTSDDEGRYSYEKQPDVGFFNLDKLRLALQPLITSTQQEHIRMILRGYGEIYKTKFMDLFGQKLGIKLNMGEDDDENFIAVLLKMMEETKADLTMTFRQLGEITIVDLEKGSIRPSLWALQELQTHDWFHRWVQLYAQLLQKQKISDQQRRVEMSRVNPVYILRNWIAQAAIERAENNDFSLVKKVLKILENPFVKQTEAENLEFSGPPPAWASSLRVSCSS